MKKYIVVGGIVALLVIGGIWISTQKTTPVVSPDSQRLDSSSAKDVDAPKEVEKCLCGNCNLDILTCACPVALEQRKKLGM